MEQKIIIRSEVIQTQKDKRHMLEFIVYLSVNILDLCLILTSYGIQKSTICGREKEDLSRRGDNKTQVTWVEEGG